MLTDAQLLSSPVVSGVLSHQTAGLHKSAATLLGVPQEAELADFVRALGTKLAYQTLIQGAIRDGIDTYASLKGVASPGALPFARAGSKTASTVVSGNAAARAARRAAAAHAPAEALAAAASHVPPSAVQPSHMRLRTDGNMQFVAPHQAEQYLSKDPSRIIALPKSGPALPVPPKPPETDIWDQTGPVRRKLRRTEELDLGQLRAHLQSQGYNPEALGFAPVSPKLAAMRDALRAALL